MCFAKQIKHIREIKNNNRRCTIFLKCKFEYLTLNIISFFYTALTCDTEELLVGGATPIPDDHMTATSVHYIFSPYKARLYEESAWCPSLEEVGAPAPNMYLQVSLTTFKLGWVVLCSGNHILRSVQIIGVAGLTACSLFLLQAERLN